MLGGDSETRLLEESLGVVNEQSYLMRQAMVSEIFSYRFLHRSFLCFRRLETYVMY